MRSRKVDGRKLQETRERKGLNVPRFLDLLAAELGREVSIAMVSKVENGHREPGAELFAAWCSVLGIKNDEDVLLPVGDAA